MPGPNAPSPTQQDQASTWDEVATTYAQSVAQWLHYAEEGLRLVPVGAEDRVLDIATGPGTLALLAAAHATHVTAVDFSPRMIEELQQRAAREGVGNVEGAVMDAQSLALPDGAFDAAFCLFAFFFFPDRARAFREMYRVLRPGGRALIATWAPIDRRPLMQVGFEAFQEALPQLPRPGKGDLQTTDDCIREMTAAGFREVTTHLVSHSLHFTSAEHYLELVIKATAPCAVLRKKMGETAFQASMDRLLVALRKRIPDTGLDLSAEAILTVGRR